jgi:hypothetical protein
MMNRIVKNHPDIQQKIAAKVPPEKMVQIGIESGLKVLLGQTTIADVFTDIANDPKAQKIAIDTVTKEPDLQREIFESLTSEEKNQIFNMAFNDPEFKPILNLAISGVLNDPNASQNIIKNLPPEVLDKIMKDMLV